jgi:hypothetical protein
MLDSGRPKCRSECFTTGNDTLSARQHRRLPVDTHPSLYFYTVPKAGLPRGLFQRFQALDSPFLVEAHLDFEVVRNNFLVALLLENDAHITIIVLHSRCRLKDCVDFTII